MQQVSRNYSAVAWVDLLGLPDPVYDLTPAFYLSRLPFRRSRIETDTGHKTSA
jgi:hypothetical protein